MDKLQWGNRKRLRCVKVKDKNSSSPLSSSAAAAAAAAAASFNRKSDGTTSVVVKKKITSRLAHNNNNNKEAQQHHQQHNASLPPLPSPHRIHRDLGMSRSNASQNRKSSLALSPEKENRYCTTRGSVGLDDNSKIFVDAKEDKKKLVWPRLIITLSSKEKEEDFMAMKGCKLPQRPKKRAKLIQKTILLVSPGAWLSDLCQERYEVREKKTSKKKPRGLKAMGSMESDSE